MAEKECHDIRKVDKYVDSHGREVLVFTQLFGKDKEEPLVKGAVLVRVGMMNQGGQNIRIEWAFPEGTSIKKAFETFDEEAKAEVEKLKKMHEEQMKANQVIPARSMPPILGANGKAMTVVKP